jgi:hypothetical protein
MKIFMIISKCIFLKSKSSYPALNVCFTFKRPNIICYKIAEKLKETCLNSQPLVFLINNEKINPKNELPMYRVLSLNGDYKLIDAKLGKNQIEKGTYALGSQLLNSKAYNDLNDFDNHLDNINKDWLNVKINDIIINSKQELLG